MAVKFHLPSHLVTPRNSRSQNRWLSLLTFAFAVIVDNSEGGLVNGLFPTLRQALGLSLFHLSLLTNINKLINMVMGPFWGFAADRYNRKRILVFITGLWGVWTVVTGFSQNFNQLLGLYLIASLGSVASAPIIMSILTDLFSDHERGKAMGIFGSISIILAAIVTPTLSQFARLEAWRYAYFIIGGCSILSGWLIWVNFTDPGRGAADRPSTDSQAFSQPRKLVDFLTVFRIPSLVFLFSQKLLNSGQLIWVFGTVFIVDIFGFSNAKAIIVLAVPQFLGNVLGNIGGGYLGDRVNRLSPKYGRILLMQVGLFMSAVMSYLATQINWQYEAALYVMFFIWGIFLSWGTGIDRPLLAAVTPPSLRATAYSIWMGIGDSLAYLLWVSLAGWLGDRYGLRPVFLVCLTGVMTIRSFLWLWLYHPYARDLDRIQDWLSTSG